MADTGHPRRWFILGILNLSLVLVVASVSSLNLSLPSIQRALDASAADLIWINAAYALVFAAFLLPAGALGDRFGRKGALLTGLVVFVLGSLLGSTADTAGQVIAFRATMGIGAALMEECVVDERYGYFVNHDLAEYQVPVHADIPDIDVVFLDELDDKSSPIKAKGVGELGICGVGAAVANAVYNACGVRVRDYPLTMDKIMPKLPAVA